MRLRQVDFHMASGKMIVMTGVDANDFALALTQKRIQSEWVIFPIDERTGFQQIIHLSCVEKVDQFFDMSDEEETNDISA